MGCFPVGKVLDIWLVASQALEDVVYGNGSLGFLAPCWGRINNDHVLNLTGFYCNNGCKKKHIQQGPRFEGFSISSFMGNASSLYSTPPANLPKPQPSVP